MDVSGVRSGQWGLFCAAQSSQGTLPGLRHTFLQILEIFSAYNSQLGVPSWEFPSAFLAASPKCPPSAQGGL